MAHRWHFFRAGGVDQVSLRDGKDLTSLVELDQKLWVALAMPIKGVDLDVETLDLIDTDKAAFAPTTALKGAGSPPRSNSLCSPARAKGAGVAFT